MPVKAAVRETKEETGVQLEAENLTFLGERQLSNNGRRPIVDIHFYVATLTVKQPPKITRPLEILETQWFPLANLPTSRSKTVALAAELFEAAKTSLRP